MPAKFSLEHGHRPCSSQCSRVSRLIKCLSEPSREQREESPGRKPIRGWVADLFCVKTRGVGRGDFFHLDLIDCCLPCLLLLIVLTAEVKYSSRKIALKTARDGEKNMTHDSVNIFFKLSLKNLFEILHFGTNYSHRVVHMYFFYKQQKIVSQISINDGPH